MMLARKFHAMKTAILTSNSIDGTAVIDEGGEIDYGTRVIVE